MVRKLVFSFIALVLYGNDNRSFLVHFLKINRLPFHFFSCCALVLCTSMKYSLIWPMSTLTLIAGGTNNNQIALQQHYKKQNLTYLASKIQTSQKGENLYFVQLLKMCWDRKPHLYLKYLNGIHQVR